MKSGETKYSKKK